MKKLTITIAAILIAISSYSQTVNGLEISSIESEYMEIIAISKLMSNKVNISLQFGQEDKMFKMKDSALLDANGKQVKFNSVTDALNFFNEVGYEFIDRVVVTGNYGMYYSIILKRKP